MPETPQNQDNAELQELWQRYHALGHAMQSGVAFTMPKAPKETEPKHLRVGVNSALVNSSALARLLMDKGLITEREYVEALVAGMEAEVESYRQRMAEMYGVALDTIKLM